VRERGLGGEGLRRCDLDLNHARFCSGCFSAFALDSGPWTLDSGLWTLDPGLLFRFCSGLWTLDSGLSLLWTLDPRLWTALMRPRTGSRFLACKQRRSGNCRDWSNLHRWDLCRGGAPAPRRTSFPPFLTTKKGGAKEGRPSRAGGA